MFKSFMDRLGTSARALYRLAADRLRLAVNSVTATQLAAACYVLGVVSALLVVHGAARAQGVSPPAARAETSSGGAVVLYNEPGLCKPPAQRAEYVHRTDYAAAVSGCWVLGRGPDGSVRVRAVFLDGDVMIAPQEAFK